MIDIAHLVFGLTVFVMGIGALGTLLPIIPGTPIIFLAALGYGYYEGFHKVTVLVLIILFFLMLCTFLIDYLAGVIGAKKYGGSKYGIWGSFIGGIVGLMVLNIPGLLAGPVLGAIIGELINGCRPEQALKVGLGTVIGIAGGAFFKIMIALTMIAVYIGNVV